MHIQTYQEVLDFVGHFEYASEEDRDLTIQVILTNPRDESDNSVEAMARHAARSAVLSGRVGEDDYLDVVWDEILTRPECAQHAARWLVRLGAMAQFKVAAEIAEERMEEWKAFLPAEEW